VTLGWGVASGLFGRLPDDDGLIKKKGSVAELQEKREGLGVLGEPWVTRAPEEMRSKNRKQACGKNATAVRSGQFDWGTDVQGPLRGCPGWGGQAGGIQT